MSVLTSRPQYVRIEPPRGWSWRVYVASGMEIAFDVRWDSAERLQPRLVTSESFEGWEAKRRKRVDARAMLFGVGRIQGALVPPTPVMVLDHPDATRAPVVPWLPPAPQRPADVSASVWVRPESL